MMVGAGRLSHWDCFVKVVSRAPVHDAMNTLFEFALKEEMDAIVWFDDDCGMPVDAIPRLVKHVCEGRSFVAGLGFMRNFPHTTTVGRWYPEGLSLSKGDDGRYKAKGFHWLDDVARFADRPLLEADFCGFPIAIVSTRALAKLEYPWFHVRDADGGGCTHDIYFCRQLQKAGIPVLVDTTMECKHLSVGGWMDFKTREWMRLMAKATRTVPGAEALKQRLEGVA